MNIFDIHNIFLTIYGYPLSYVEFIGTLFGLLCVWLAAVKNIFTWPTGLINITCFFAVFFQVSLYSDMFLQIFFFVTSIYGWINWSRKKDDNKSIDILKHRPRVVYSIIILVMTIALGFFMKNIHLIFPHVFKHPAAYPFFDTFVAVSSIIATFLLAKQIVENWLLWIIVDIICIVIYAKKGILFISVEYAFFLIISTFGLYSWMKSYKRENTISVASK